MKLKSFFVCATILIASIASVHAGSLTLLGAGAGVSSGSNPLALDGGSTNSVAPASSLGLTLTTTGGSGMIVLGMVFNGNTAGVSSISGTGLTFTAASASPTLSNGGGDRVFLYTAPYSTNFSGTITVNFTTSANVVGSVIGIKSATAIDSNGSVGNTSGGPAMTTTTAKSAVIAIIETSGAAASAGTGWTASPGSVATAFEFMLYQIASSTNTFTATMSAGTILGGIITAVH